MHSLCDNTLLAAVAILTLLISSAVGQPFDSITVPSSTKSAVLPFQSASQSTNADSTKLQYGTNPIFLSRDSRTQILTFHSTLAWPSRYQHIAIPNRPKAFLVFTSLTPPTLEHYDLAHLLSMIADKLLEWALVSPGSNLSSFTETVDQIRFVMIINKDPKQPQLSKETGFAALELFQKMLYYDDPLQGMVFWVYDGDPSKKRGVFVVQRLPLATSANAKIAPVTDGEGGAARKKKGAGLELSFPRDHGLAQES
ncbi:MAG: hypothetical protein Q9217_004359 [Psora testacea]